MRRGLIAGFALWLVTYLAFRLLGPFGFHSSLTVLATFLAGGLFVALLGLLACWFACEPGKLARFAAAIAIPGLLLDSACVIAFSEAFPGIPVSFSAIFAACTLWGYGLLLSALLLFGQRLVPSA